MALSKHLMIFKVFAEKLTTSLAICIGLDKQDIERWGQVTGNLRLFLYVFKRH